MNCIRCAKNTEENQLFCNECLKDMERHPVKPGTPVQLPNREDRAPAKRKAFRLADTKWKNQIFLLKYKIFWLWVLIILLLIVLTISILGNLGLMPRWLDEVLGLTDLKIIVLNLINK